MKLFEKIDEVLTQSFDKPEEAVAYFAALGCFAYGIVDVIYSLTL